MPREDQQSGSICLERVQLLPSARTPPIVCNLYISDRAISEIDTELQRVEPVDERIDCSHHVAIPGLVNMHLHCRPGRAMNDGMPVPIWHKTVDRIAQEMTPDESYVGGLTAFGEMLLGGITGSLAMTRFFDHAARAADDLGIRAAIVPLAGDLHGTHGHALDDLSDALERVRTDSRPAGSRVQLWPGFDSPLSTSFDGMRKVADLAAQRGLGLHAHLAETQTECDKFAELNGQTEGEALLAAGLLREQAIMAHCNWLTEYDVESFVNHGTSIAHNPTSNMKFASGICPVKELRAAGINVALGTDGMLSNFHLNMFETMRAAAGLQRIHTGDPSALTAPDVFQMATTGGATLLGNRVGILEVGWAADITVLDMSGLHLQPYRRDPINNQDLLNLIVWCARPSDVQHVICDGRIVVRDRQLVRIATEEIADRARQVDARLRPVISKQPASAPTS